LLIVNQHSIKWRDKEREREREILGKENKEEREKMGIGTHLCRAPYYPFVNELHDRLMMQREPIH
jgi:hypothetical protein